MFYIIHRVNKIKELKRIPYHYGVEVDVRGYGKKMLLSHDPINDRKKYDELENYLYHFGHAFIIFNIKEAGYEQNVIGLAKKYNIKNYFLLDVEFPFLYRATRKDRFRKVAVRYSEAEPIEYVEAQKANGNILVDWVWIDTNTVLPLNESSVDKLKSFKTCLVSPERWGRPQEVPFYIKKMKLLNFKPDAILTTLENVVLWENDFRQCFYV